MESTFKNVDTGSTIIFICPLDPKSYLKTKFLDVFGVFFLFLFLNFYYIIYNKINFYRKTKNTVFKTHREESLCQIPSIRYDWFGLGKCWHTNRQITSPNQHFYWTRLRYLKYSQTWMKIRQYLQIIPISEKTLDNHRP